MPDGYDIASSRSTSDSGVGRAEGEPAQDAERRSGPPGLADRHHLHRADPVHAAHVAARTGKAQTYPPSWGAPLTFANYSDLFGGTNNIIPPLLNSLQTSIISTILVLCLAIPAAYALSIRPVRKWTDAMFFFLSTKMLPPVAGILPIYLFTNKVIHLPDNVLVLIILYTSMNLPIAVWMMRSFLAEVPVPIIEAASLDGAGTLTIMRKIVTPISLPGIAATSLICFIFAWNEQLFAKVLTSVNARTAPVFVNTLIQTEHSYLAQLCAGTVAISVPVLVAGFAAQDKLVQGMSLGAVK